MDQEVCKSIVKLIGKMSTNGGQTVDQKGVKDLIHYAGKSEEYLKFTHEKLLKQLKKKHSEIRLGVFLIIEEFFKKSAFYRELILDEFRTILDLTTGADSKNPMPPPAEAAEQLKQRTVNAFQKWQGKFSKTHPRLPIAYNYISKVLKNDCGDQPSQSVNDIANTKEQREYHERKQSSMLESLQQALNEQRQDISTLILEISNCFNLIIPKPEQFMGDYESDAHGDNLVQNDVDMREHGFSFPLTISIELNENHITEVPVTEDNHALVETLNGLLARAKKRYYPMIVQWARMATRCGLDDDLEAILTWKKDLESHFAKHKQLNLISTSTHDLPNSQSDGYQSSDDDDFEEVPEKEGYEDFAIAPPVVPKVRSLANHSKSSAGPTTSTSTSWSIIPPLKDEEYNDPTYGLPPSEMQRLSSSAVSTPSKSTNTVEQLSQDRKSKLLAVAPKLPFDVDLYHWEDATLKAPSIEVADTGVHRFWQPLDREGETIENPDGIAALRTRRIEFTGKFEPVQWSCRAPLSSGNLCPRRDREKCPFHGKIIPRDKQGNPTKEDDIVRLQAEKELAEKNKVPEWQDPTFLKELKEKIGIDLTIRRPKRGGKSFADKYPQLTDIRKRKDDSRKRLEKKVFNRKSLKRVAEALDNANAKKFRDKFGDQFNYNE